MQLKPLIKGSALTILLLALTACGSTQDEVTKSETNVPEVQKTDVVVEEAPKVIELTAEELRAQELATLMEANVLYFDYDQDDIRSEFIDILDQHSKFLADNPTQSVLIEGHADERGTPEYNIALGERRAKAVSRYMQSMGVLDSQITVVSYGEEKPADTSHTEDAFALNRRAVLAY